MIAAIYSAVRFWWTGCKGHRLMPWRSPYLRWRVETFTGKPAGSLKPADFIALFKAERKQMGSYLGWLGEMREIATERKQP